MTIIILSNIFSINKVIVVKGTNSIIIVTLPKIDDIVILFILARLFSKTDTASNSKKSNAKFKKIIRSKYIFIYSPIQV